MRDNAAEIRDRIADYCRQLESKLANLEFDGKRATLAAFGVKVQTTRDEMSMTVVVDPRVTTIAQTSALLRERSRRCRWA